MRDHEEVYNRVLERIEQYEQSRRERNVMLRKRVLPTAAAIVILTAVGLYVTWSGRAGSNPETAPGEQPQITDVVKNPDGPGGQKPENVDRRKKLPDFAEAKTEPKYVGNLNGCEYVADNGISDDGKEAYAYTKLTSGDAESFADVVAEFHGIDSKTQAQVVYTATAVVTENRDGQCYGIVRYQIPDDSDVVIVRVVSEHLVSEPGGVNLEFMLTAENIPQDFNKRTPMSVPADVCELTGENLPVLIVDSRKQIGRRNEA
ncbi:MAG: hypothetical protein IKX54_05215 [Lachnospiraceae bacterium]|nr:hypothetical protein [Lachnospiraceae bacterium]